MESASAGNEMTEGFETPRRRSTKISLAAIGLLLIVCFAGPGAVSALRVSPFGAVRSGADARSLPRSLVLRDIKDTVTQIRAAAVRSLLVSDVRQRADLVDLLTALQEELRRKSEEYDGLLASAPERDVWRALQRQWARYGEAEIAFMAAEANGDHRKAAERVARAAEILDSVLRQLTGIIAVADESSAPAAHTGGAGPV